LGCRGLNELVDAGIGTIVDLMTGSR